MKCSTADEVFYSRRCGQKKGISHGPCFPEASVELSKKDDNAISHKWLRTGITSNSESKLPSAKGPQ
jgi:hypothetical protein